MACGCAASSAGRSWHSRWSRRSRGEPVSDRSTRPLLKPALRRLWRDHETLQLGLAPPHAVVLAGLTAGDRSVLDLLDGTRHTDAVLDTAVEAGHDRRRVA